jgi:hypothetical protein
MSSFESFLYRVSEAGVPHHVPYAPYDHQATLRGLSTQEVADLYWLLETLTVDYHYTINGVGLQRHYSIQATDYPPIQRPKFQSFVINKMGYDPLYNYPYIGAIRFGTIFQDPQQAEHYGLNLSIYEEDGTGYNLFCLTTDDEYESLNARVDSTFSFMGKDCTLYLYYNPNYVSSASLDTISLSAEFFSNEDS